jgi:hypothetical protein
MALPLLFAGAATGGVRSSDDGSAWAPVLPQVARSNYGTTWGLLNANVKTWVAVNTAYPESQYGDNLRSGDVYGLTIDPVDASRHHVGYCNSVQ